MGQIQDSVNRHNQQCDNNEVALGRAHQPPQIRQMDLACHYLENI